MEDSRLMRAQMLMGQRRLDEAEKLLLSYLTEEPNDASAINLLATIKYERAEFRDAEEAIENAIGLEPDNPYHHYIRAAIKLGKSEKDQAAESLNTAIALDPGNAEYYVLMAEILFSRSKFEEALSFSDTALEVNPENVNARNVRSKILLALNRPNEAFDAIAGSLEEDPENADTYAELGWNYLRKNDPKKALENFTEALRLEPHNEYAKGGLVEALKAKYLIYRLFLRYVFWFEKREGNTRAAIIIGAYIGFRLLRSASNNYPVLKPFIVPVLGLYMAFALSTWLLNPIFNIFLLVNPYGKYALKKFEKIGAQIALGLLITMVVGGVGYLGTGIDKLLMLAIAAFGLIIPATHTFDMAYHEIPKGLAIYTGVLTLLAIAGISLSPNLENVHPVAFAFLIGSVGFQWIANFLIFRKN